MGSPSLERPTVVTCHNPLPEPNGDPDSLVKYDATLSSDAVADQLTAASADGASRPVLIFADDFSDTGWTLFGEDEFSSSYVEETYELAVSAGGFSSAFGLPSGLGTLSDFYFEVETRAFGPADNGYGIRFREGPSGFFDFTISNLGTGAAGEPIESGGTFSVDKFTGTAFERVLPFKSETDAISQGEGELNVLSVLALGPDVTLYINGQEVGSFSDPDLVSGQLSVRLNPYFEEGSRVQFDNAAVWVPAD